MLCKNAQILLVTGFLFCWFLYFHFDLIVFCMTHQNAANRKELEALYVLLGLEKAAIVLCHQLQFYVLVYLYFTHKENMFEVQIKL